LILIFILCYRTSSSTWRWAWDSHRPGSGQSKVGRPTRSHLLARHSKMAALNQPPRKSSKIKRINSNILWACLSEKGAGDRIEKKKKINGNTHAHTHRQRHTETHSHSVQQPKNMTGSQFQYANSPIIIIIRGLGESPPFSWWFSGCLHNGLAQGGEVI
jgi:hypothetical protein